MFYMFHHIPKCGGTSFNAFLNSIFEVVNDYHNPGGPKNDVALFQKYRDTPLNLEELNAQTCVSGHYNMDGVFLWQRYPMLDRLEHKKFSIIRDPFEAAKSGVYFNIKRGIFKNPGPQEIKKQILNRANIFSKTLGICWKDDIDRVLDRYWFVAPLDRVQEAAGVIEAAVGRKGPPVGHANVTRKPEDEDTELAARFREKAALDYAIYDRACARFDAFVRTAIPA